MAPRNSIRWTDEMRETVTRMYQQYYPTSQIAAAIGEPTREVAVKAYISANLKLRRSPQITYLLRDRPHLHATLINEGTGAFVSACENERRLANERHAAQQAERDAAVSEILESEISRNEKLERLRAVGLSLQKCGALFGITYQRVQQIEQCGFLPSKQRMPKLLRAWTQATPDQRDEFLEATGLEPKK